MAIAGSAHIRLGVRVAVFASAVALGVVAATAQFESRVEVVELYVSVIDGHGSPVGGLGRDDFAVFEDGARQQLMTFSAGRLPLALAVALDRSFSVAGPRLAVMKTAIEGLVDALAEADRVTLLAVGSRVEVVSPLGTDRAPLRRALAAVDAFGTTSLRDAMIAAVDLVQPSGGRRALVLLSDGEDRYSAASAAEVTAHVGARDVLVFPVAVGAAAPPLFVDVAAATGGRALGVRDPSRLRATLRTLAGELAAQYLLRYAPSRRVTTRAWRGVEVRVARPGLAVRTRRGYWTR
jgi:Ca-activated chloride channel homolog